MLKAFGSVRVRLTLWNVAVLALVLAFFGLALCYRVGGSLERSIDQQLSIQAHALQAVLSSNSAAEGGATAAARRLSRYMLVTLRPGEDFFRRPRLIALDGTAVIPAVHQRPWDSASLVAAARGEERFSTVRLFDTPVRVLSVPVWPQSHPESVSVLQVAAPLSDLQYVREGQLGTLLLLLPLALLVAGAGGVFLTDRALRPVQRVTGAARELSAGDLSRRLEVKGSDELAELASTFNGMLGRLERAFGELDAAYHRTEQAYAALERTYEQQRRFTGDASHELRTPLSRLKLISSVSLARPRRPAEYREALRTINEEAGSMNKLVQDLLLLARSDAAGFMQGQEAVPLAEVVHRAAKGYPPEGAPRLELAVAGNPIVRGDRELLVRLVENLLENAARHTPERGTVTVSVEEREETAYLTVTDTGEGIPAEHLPHVCERFYRADESRSREGGGAGLGLAICRSIAEAHGGSLSLESTVGSGTTVRLRLAACSAQPKPFVAPAAALS